MERRLSLIKEKAELETELRAGGNKLSLDRLLRLAEVHKDMGNVPTFVNMTTQLLKNQNLPNGACLQVAQWYIATRQYGVLSNAVNAFLRSAPPDVPAKYREAAKMYGAARMLNESAGMMEKYVEHAPRDWQALRELSVMYFFMKNFAKGFQALRPALTMGGDEARKTVVTDARLLRLCRDNANFEREFRKLLQETDRSRFSPASGFPGRFNGTGVPRR